MENKYQQITLCRDEYKKVEDFWHDLTSLVRILTGADYELRVYYEGCDVYVIQFNYSPNKGYGTPHLEWVADDEYIGKFDEDKGMENE